MSSYKKTAYYFVKRHNILLKNKRRFGWTDVWQEVTQGISGVGRSFVPPGSFLKIKH